MTVAKAKSSSLARNFLGQLFALGFFARIVQILAILGLLNLNDYFTTPAQIPTLLPVGTLIILVLIVVAIADSISSRVSQRVIERLARAQQVYGFESGIAGSVSTPAQQRHYLRTIFFPLLTAVSPAPLLIVVLVSNTPMLFIISVLQAITNAAIVRHYNQRYRQRVQQAPPAPRPTPESLDERQSFLLRRTGSDQGTRLEIQNKSSRDPEADLGRKKDILRTSNLVFRGLILMASAILAIYKLSALSSVVGFFILNNTLRYAAVVLAEYCWPPFRHLTFKQACQLIDTALQQENYFLLQLQKQQELEQQARQDFDRRMAQRLIQKPYLRLKDFRLLKHHPIKRTILDGITARIELMPITLIHVSGAALSDDLATLITDQKNNHNRAECQGIAVCGQLNVDVSFWRQLPIADVQRNRVVTANLIDHFPPEHRSRLQRLVADHDVNRFYLEGDPQPINIQDLSRRQIRRLRALISLLDALLHPHCLWLLPFVLDSFEESESRSLLELYAYEVSAQQRSVFLLSRPLPSVDETYASYELRRSSLKRYP